MAEESWHAARLIPTSGINGPDEQERRATSALLAVISAVKEFRRTLLGPLGAPAGACETYIEVPFQLGGREVRPDGLIRVSWGTKVWTALVEVKTGKNDLQTAQLEAYLDVAREQKYDALITISNEIPASATVHPTPLDKRKLRNVALYHLPWSFVLSQAVLQKEHRGVEDPDQAWILGELIRYLEHPKSGALDFDDMGADWVPLREAVHAGTLRAGDKTITDVTSRFDALLRFAALHLGRRLGTEVVHQLTRKELADPALRASVLRTSLVDSGTMSGSIKVPDTVGAITVTADLRASKITCSVDIDAPRTGRATTRVNWILKQLKDAPATVRVEAFAMNQRGPGSAELLATLRENPAAIIADPSKDLRAFRIAATTAMGSKRGRGRGAFIDTVVDSIDDFYQDVLQQLRPWAAAAPKLRDEPELPPDVRPSLVSTAISSQDDPEHEPVASPATSPMPTPVAVPAENAYEPEPNPTPVVDESLRGGCVPDGDG